MKAKLEKLIQHLNEGLIEREEAARLALLAALAGEHILFSVERGNKALANILFGVLEIYVNEVSHIHLSRIHSSLMI